MNRLETVTSGRAVRAYIDGLDFAPTKTLGQNFLVDTNMRDFIVKAADLQPGDRVLEVGPGLGALSEKILGQVKELVAVEMDAKLYQHLQAHFSDSPGLQLIHADALSLDLESMVGAGLNKMVSNLPYSAGTRILYELASAPQRPECMVVTVQDDVAQRMAAPAGGKIYGLISVWMQLHYRVEKIRKIDPACFHPRPRVGSTVMRLTRHETPGLADLDRKRLERLLKYCFSQRRKQLGSILRKAPGDLSFSAEELQARAIEPTLRPERLEIPDWIRLAGPVD